MELNDALAAFRPSEDRSIRTEASALENVRVASLIGAVQL